MAGSDNDRVDLFDSIVVCDETLEEMKQTARGMWHKIELLAYNVRGRL